MNQRREKEGVVIPTLNIPQAHPLLINRLRAW